MGLCAILLVYAAGRNGETLVNNRNLDPHRRGIGNRRPQTLSPSSHFVESQTANLMPRDNGSLPRKNFNILYQAHIWPRWETPSSHRPTIKVPRVSCPSNQPQYELLRQFL